MKVSVKKAVNEVRSQPWDIVLFPLAIEICVPDTSGDSVFQVLQIIRIHSCGTRIMMKISYHKQYHGDTAAY